MCVCGRVCVNLWVCMYTYGGNWTEGRNPDIVVGLSGTQRQVNIFHKQEDGEWHIKNLRNAFNIEL